MVAGVESEMASLALDWCSLRLQSGHTEVAVAGIQALLEWHLFAPEGEPVSGMVCISHNGKANIWKFL